MSVSISSTSTNLTTYTSSTSTNATEVLTLSLNINTPQIASIAGSKTTGDVLKLTFIDAGLSGGVEQVSYTVLSTDTLNTIASGVASAINADTHLQAIGVSATSSGKLVTIQSNSSNLTSYRQTTSSGATETIALTQPEYTGRAAVIGGTKTTGNVLTITAYDTALTGGKESVSYSVLSTDTLASIATGLAAAVNADSNLSAIGVSATANSTVVTLESLSPNLTTYTQSTSTGATETIALAKTTGVTQSTYNNVNELVGLSPGGGTYFQGTTNKPIVSGAVNSQVVNINAPAVNSTSYSYTASGAATETLTVLGVINGSTTIAVGGTVTPGDVLTVSIYDPGLPNGGPTTGSYTVRTGDTLATIASALSNAFSINAPLFVTGYYPGGNNFIIYHRFAGVFATTYTTAATRSATEAVTFGANVNGNTTATVSGTATTGDTVTVFVQNSNLSGGSTSVNHVVTSTDTLSTIASALASAISASTALQGIGVSATSSSQQINISFAVPTYSQSTSVGATETITLGTNSLGNTTATIGGTPTAGDTLTITVVDPLLPSGQRAVTYTVASGNSIVDVAVGLAAALAADANLSSAGFTAAAGSSQNLANSQNFSATATLPPGLSLAQVACTDARPVTQTNPYAMSLNTGSTKSLTFDANGNMTSDGTNSYAWDCENRLIKVTYPGTGNYSQFGFDGLGRDVLIQEYTGNTLSSTKMFVWNELGERCEARDSGGSIAAQYFARGQTLSGIAYMYTFDHLNSVREMTDSSGNVHAQYNYDPYGQVAKIQGNLDADFKYATHYKHAASDLDLTAFRQYNPSLALWLSPDPLSEAGRSVSYAYANNRPGQFVDTSGLCACKSQTDKWTARLLIHFENAESYAQKGMIPPNLSHLKPDPGATRYGNIIHGWFFAETALDPELNGLLFDVKPGPDVVQGIPLPQRKKCLAWEVTSVRAKQDHVERFQPQGWRLVQFFTYTRIYVLHFRGVPIGTQVDPDP